MIKKCRFCKLLIEKKGKKRLINKNKSCVAMLDIRPQRRGHTLVILKNHKEDLADKDLSSEELKDFINMIHETCKHLKKEVTNEKNERPDKIYVCSLCDGDKHLHAHLIPRYPYTRKDKKFYKKLYPEKEGINPGFWYLCLGEIIKNEKREEITKEEIGKILKLLNPDRADFNNAS